MLPKYETPKTEGESMSWRGAMFIVVVVVGVFVLGYAGADLLERGKAEEWKHILRTVHGSDEVAKRFGAAVRIEVVREKPPGWRRKVRELWKRKRIFDGAEGEVLLFVDGNSGCGEVRISYGYTLSSGEFRVSKFEIDSPQPRSGLRK